MNDIVTRWAHRIWRWLLRQAHDHPVRSGLGVVIVLSVLSFTLGAGMREWQESWLKWLDNALTVLTGASLVSGWAIALVVRAQQREVALSFRNAGEAVEMPAFDAALILASPSKALMDWHLRHIKPKRVEPVWTDHTRASTAAILDLHTHVICLHGPGKDDEEALLDAFNLHAVKSQCSILLKELLARYPQEKVCVDLTGGTAVMSIAAFQVAEELGVTSIYLMGGFRPPDGRSPQIRDDHVHERDEGIVVILSDHTGRDRRLGNSDEASLKPSQEQDH